MKKKLPVKISAKAFKEILLIKEQKKIADEYSLRLGVKSAGCGVASYIIEFDHVNEKDEIYEMENFNIFTLAGKSVDYGNADGETEFKFKDGN